MCPHVRGDLYKRFHTVYIATQETAAFNCMGIPLYKINSFLVYSNAKRMPTDVQDALKTVCITHGGLSETEAAAFMKHLVDTRRLQLETWA